MGDDNNLMSTPPVTSSDATSTVPLLLFGSQNPHMHPLSNNDQMRSLQPHHHQTYAAYTTTSQPLMIGNQPLDKNVRYFPNQRTTTPHQGFAYITTPQTVSSIINSDPTNPLTVNPYLGGTNFQIQAAQPHSQSIHHEFSNVAVLPNAMTNVNATELETQSHLFQTSLLPLSTSQVEYVNHDAMTIDFTEDGEAIFSAPADLDKTLMDTVAAADVVGGFGEDTLPHHIITSESSTDGVWKHHEGDGRFVPSKSVGSGTIKSSIVNSSVSIGGSEPPKRQRRSQRQADQELKAEADRIKTENRNEATKKVVRKLSEKVEDSKKPKKSEHDNIIIEHEEECSEQLSSEDVKAALDAMNHEFDTVDQTTEQQPRTTKREKHLPIKLRTQDENDTNSDATKENGNKKKIKQTKVEMTKKLTKSPTKAMKKKAKKHNQTASQNSSNIDVDPNPDGGEQDDNDDDDEDDSDWKSEDDPERLWCICKKPHANKFMICCDSCLNWFHGTCVGVTQKDGKLLEERGDQWLCKECKTPTVTKKQEQPMSGGDHPNSKDISPTDLKNNKLTDLQQSSHKRKHHGGSVKKLSAGGVTSSTTTNTPIKMDRQICFNCERRPRSDEMSIYCSNTCLESHLKKMKEYINRQRATQNTVSVIAVEPMTHKMLVGPSAPPVDKIEPWLRTHPSFHYVLPSTLSKSKVYENLKSSHQGSHPNNSRKSAPSHHSSTSSDHHYTTLSESEEIDKQLSVYRQGSHHHKALSINLMESAAHSTTTTDAEANSSSSSAPHSATEDDAVLDAQKTSSSSSLQSTTPSKFYGTNSHAVQNRTFTSTNPSKGVGHHSTTKKASNSSHKQSVVAPAVNTSDVNIIEDVIAREKIKVRQRQVRDNARKGLRDALLAHTLKTKKEGGSTTNDDDKKKEEVDDLATDIEHALYKLYNRDADNPKYKSKYRSLVFNIRDERNVKLRDRIINGEISARKLVSMSPDQLAYSELRHWREKELKGDIEKIKAYELELLKRGEYNKYVVKSHKGEEVVISSSKGAEKEGGQSGDTAIVLPEEEEDLLGGGLHKNRRRDKHGKRRHRHHQEEKSRHHDGSTRSSSSAGDKKDRDHHKRSRDHHHHHSSSGSGSTSHKRRDEIGGGSSHSHSSSHDSHRKSSSTHKSSRDHHTSPDVHSSASKKQLTLSPSTEEERRKEEALNAKLANAQKILNAFKTTTPPSIDETEIHYADGSEELGESKDGEFDDEVVEELLDQQENTSISNVSISQSPTVSSSTTFSSLPSVSHHPSSGRSIPSDPQFFTPPLNVSPTPTTPPLVLEPHAAVSSSFAKETSHGFASDNVVIDTIRWKGRIEMIDGATPKFPVVGHACFDFTNYGHLSEDLRHTLKIVGRIHPQSVHDYLSQMRHLEEEAMNVGVRVREVVVLRLSTGVGDTSSDGYWNLYDYLKTRQRVAVIGQMGKEVKDCYIMALPSTQPIHESVLPDKYNSKKTTKASDEDCDKRDDMLALILVRTKRNQSSVRTHTQHHKRHSSDTPSKIKVEVTTTTSIKSNDDQSKILRANLPLPKVVASNNSRTLKSSDASNDEQNDVEHKTTCDLRRKDDYDDEEEAYDPESVSFGDMNEGCEKLDKLNEEIVKQKTEIGLLSGSLMTLTSNRVDPRLAFKK